MSRFPRLDRCSALWLALALGAPPASYAQQHLRDREIHDSDTLAWWHTTEALSDDSMEGRDTGSPAYQRAAEYVANRFKAAGLEPAGENGSYFQTVPMREIAVIPEGTSFTLLRTNGTNTPLQFLQQITVTPAADLAANFEAPLTFRGYCGKDAMADIAGKIVVCFGTQREGLPSASVRAANARAGGALGLINVDDPYFSIEPPRWPYAYARSVTLRARQPAKALAALASMRLSAEAFASLLAGSGQDAAAILKAGGAKQPLPSFEIPGALRAQLHSTQRDISSPNVIAKLPGRDARLKGEHVVIAAHLDGYGFGTPVKGDNLYNGTLDDAAYVALLIQTADDIKAHRVRAPKRSILFIAFTGEEKGLLGSHWFVEHPTVPAEQLAADVNLDQLRPLFPLNILTAEALGDTTLGATARAVAAPMHIEIRPDGEPERNLLYRADQLPFLSIHVPAISFIFGYDPNTEAEKRYREWYQTRYHRPQDDITQPMDFAAAAKFNTFFYRLVQTIGDEANRPTIYPTSSFAADKH
ncbi:MAG TPA: M28 family peptidase [Steroidobacteraceae bacterium]|nr:M28 family peptidase [Steroidobacteraceae bacterium]